MMHKFNKIAEGLLLFSAFVCLMTLDDVRPSVGLILLILMFQPSNSSEQEEEEES